MDALYYESHVTVEPVFGDKLIELQIAAKMNKFRVADLLLQRARKDTPERSTKDSFCTGRFKTYDDAFNRMTEFKDLLEKLKFKVWRLKIEKVVYDERFKRNI